MVDWIERWWWYNKFISLRFSSIPLFSIRKRYIRCNRARAYASVCVCEFFFNNKHSAIINHESYPFLTHHSMHRSLIVYLVMMMPIEIISAVFLNRSRWQKLHRLRKCHMLHACTRAFVGRVKENHKEMNRIKYARCAHS